jgi:hypothetical protein
MSMKGATYEGIVENGSVRLTQGIHLPESTRVYVIVPDAEPHRIVHLRSPRLVHPEQAKDFKLEVIEEGTDAKL